MIAFIMSASKPGDEGWLIPAHEQFSFGRQLYLRDRDQQRLVKHAASIPL
jgi:hypothetical protein